MIMPKKIKRAKVQISCNEAEDRTKQSMKDECDVNRIISNYTKTGLLTPVTQDPGIYVDVSEVGDYKEALAQIDLAEGMFNQLPSTIRAKFKNDPAEFLDYASDETNVEEMINMGLLPDARGDIVTEADEVEVGEEE
jgi:phage internal scaffolding protein